MNNIKISFFVLGVLTVIGVIFVVYGMLFGAPQKEVTDEVFIVSLTQTEEGMINKLKEHGFIKNVRVFALVLHNKQKSDDVAPGGYHISKNMTTWQIAEKISSPPDMKWVVIPEGLRKEQIGEKLAKTFDWSDAELEKWNTVYTKMNSVYIEGTYFPDTYLIPVKENGLDIAKRMTRRFDEQFAPYSTQFAEQNILWTTGLRLASIIQREAGGKSDMPIIVGVHVESTRTRYES